MLRTTLFGVPAFSLHAQSLTQAFTGRRLALFAYVLSQEHPSPRTTLTDLLWAGIAEERARENLRGLLSKVRSLVGDYLVIDRQTVAFNRAAPYWADIEVFGTFWAARSITIEPALWLATLQLYQGEFLAGVYVQDAPVFEEWLLWQRQQWQAQAVQGWQQLAHYHFTRGDDRAGLLANERLLTLEPWQEEAHRRQMLMLARSGQRDAALAHFDRCCAILREEVDAPPDEETVALYAAIKAGEWSPGASPPADAPPVTRTVAASTPAPAMAQDEPSAQKATLAVDWGSLPQAPTFFGRQNELQHLQQWATLEGVRVVTVSGVGGQGKTALVVRLIHALRENAGPLAAPDASPLQPFERVICRSLLTAPPLTDILQDWLQQLSDQQVVTLPRTVEQQFTLLYQYLQQRRFLLVLDNVESILLDDGSGGCRPGYEAYEQLWQLIVQRDHQCCLLLTSRERPRVLSSHEEQLGALRTLLLDGLAVTDGQQLLRSHRIISDDSVIAALLHFYSGNPLALTLVADTIDELFGGNVAAFLQEETLFFADIGAVLDQQFVRLTALEVELLTWLALEQEPVTSQTLWENLAALPPKRDFLAALRTLVRRSLVQPHGELFGLQNVILEYTRNRLVNTLGEELTNDRLTTLNRYALVKAQAKEYVRAGQRRLLVEPLVHRLQAYWGQRGMAALCHRLLNALRTTQGPPGALPDGYAAANLLHLLLQMKMALAGYDFSHLTLRQACLRDAILQGVNFTAAHFRDCLFTDIFAAVAALAFHPTGELLAIGASDGQLRLVRMADSQIAGALTGPALAIFGLAIAPDGQLLVASSLDQAVYVWHLPTQTLRYQLHTPVNFVRGVAFSPDGAWLAVAGGDGLVNLYQAATGTLHCTLQSANAWVWTLAFSPDGEWLAGGDEAGKLTLWSVRALLRTGQPLGAAIAPTYTLAAHQAGIDALVFSPDRQLLFSGGRDHLIYCWPVAGLTADPAAPLQPWRTLTGHHNYVRSLAISPNGRFLASGGADATVRIWDAHSGALLDTFPGHEQWVWAVAFQPRPMGEAQLLASGGNDQRVLLWEVQSQAGVSQNRLRQTLRGYSDAVRGVAFLPNGRSLISGGFDKLIHLWDLPSGQHYATLDGHADWIFKVAVSPDGQWIASCDFAHFVYLWPCAPDLTAGRLPAGGAPQEHLVAAPRKLSGHTAVPCGLAFSPNSQLLASCGHDGIIRLWHVSSGQLLETLPGHTGWLREVAFSPDGRLLVSSGFTDRTVRLWDVHDLTTLPPADRPAAADRPTRARLLHTFADHTDPVWGVAFSPDGQLVISTSNDQTIRLRDRHGQQQRVLTGHTNAVRCLAVSPPTATGDYTLASGDNDRIIRLWGGASGELRHVLQGHQGTIHTLTFSPDGGTLVSASEQGGIRLWDVSTGTPLQTLRAPRPYTGMTITGITGITTAQKAALLTLGASEK